MSYFYLCKVLNFKRHFVLDISKKFPKCKLISVIWIIILCGFASSCDLSRHLRQRITYCPVQCVRKEENKMGKCKFNAIWLEDVKYRDWLAGTSNEYGANCKICQKTFKLGTMGVKALESHMKSEKHWRYASIRKSTVPMESYVLAPSTSTPAGSQTGNVGLNHNVQ